MSPGCGAPGVDEPVVVDGAVAVVEPAVDEPVVVVVVVVVTLGVVAGVVAGVVVDPLVALAWVVLGNGGRSGVQATTNKARARNGVNFIMLEQRAQRGLPSFRRRRSGRYKRGWFR